MHNYIAKVLETKLSFRFMSLSLTYFIEDKLLEAIG